MKNTILLLSILLTFIFTNIFAQTAEVKDDSISFSNYHITAANLDLDIVNSYPQKVTKYISKKSPYEIVIRTFSAYQDNKRRKLIEATPFRNKYSPYRYPEELKKYLEPTPLIESNSPKIKNIADSLVDYNLSMTQNIEKILKWVSSYVQFDEELANKIDKGKSNTESALKTLESKKGTCSEYTNLFIAIMRNLGIPTRFITGIIVENNGHTMYHAWAECYIEGVGWHGVDPQTAQLWIPAMGIKLFAGRDFIDCNIKTLPDIKATVKKELP